MNQKSGDEIFRNESQYETECIEQERIHLTQIEDGRYAREQEYHNRPRMSR